MALMIAGDRSGVGKTTVTLALLAFLASQKHRVQSFKVGPDYIDPMFHSAITGRPCRNLDPILTSETYVQLCFTKHCQGVEYALVEGLMGLFDGIPYKRADSTRLKGATIKTSEKISSLDYGSTAHIARLLNIPVVLVIDCSHLSGSVAAITHGYSSLDPHINLVGVILNRVGSNRHLHLLQQSLDTLNIPILGTLHRKDSLTIPTRHLGLIPTTEMTHLESLFRQLANLAQTAFNWQYLFPLLTPSPLDSLTPSPVHPLIHSSPIKIAIASDNAFSFYYQDNLDILQTLGAKLIPWSPLEDENLPKDIHGLYFGGGFPEMFAQDLSRNYRVREAVKAAIVSQIPTYAECGGLMYLCQQIIDFQAQKWPMVGILPTTAIMRKNLNLGYRQATALQDGPLLTIGQTIWGHEFHRSHLTFISKNPLFSVQDWQSNSLREKEGWKIHQLHASYIHLHFGGHSEFLRKFLGHCLDFLRSSKLN
ncbi:MAG: cobyrinate a,c-diamide synthase [cyanobacterium endosymbiont of Rhopalodia musculus]|uniref:cobyrinate a,c-diamide synthase n=1 Tax=cyanobacterium endosymbiont of Epithemia clementina EcSB TaxID=3034674 RepID=UPI002480551E|nr:cobyrinate a,c-diamide synthase [cyanobacterium endosymbiont of Epithemia clementina EcSB]WGT67342.1 cobyrinate a,c-diamide synthase [cyanobacterium endosymbiont of Epithemia clementina EcSB]